jgi:hypothetical protein
MNNVQTVESVSAELSLTPIIVNPIGKSMKDRVSSVLESAHAATALALIGEKGTVGKLAREAAAGTGMVTLIHHVSNTNYRPLAEWLAIKLNSSVVIRNRAEFDALNMILDMRILDAESKGTAAGEKLATKLRGILSDVVEIKAQAQAMFDKRKADREAAKQAEQQLESTAS